MTDDALADTLDGVRRLYESSLAEHGATPAGVGWSHPAGQPLRFAQLARLIELDRPAEPVTVADLGCGYGALFEYLEARGDVQVERYLGYDLSPAMLAAARRHVRDPRAEWRRGSVLTKTVDYTFVSGTLNVRLAASDEEWGTYVRSVLVHLYARSRRGFAFNLLTSHVDWRSDQLFYADPAEYLRFCLDELSPRVTLLHDYPLHEWTMVVRRD